MHVVGRLDGWSIELTVYSFVNLSIHLHVEQNVSVNVNVDERISEY